jgi:hypothetical protein
MKKQTYIIPSVETAPLHLSACIMSGGGSNNAPKDSEPTTDSSHLGAPKRVF